MQNQKDVAVVTGASSGLGAEFARLLAARGADLILTARRRDRLEMLADELRKKHSARVDIIENDLSRADGAERLYQAVRGLRTDVTILVNNAGFGKQATVLEHSMEELRSMIQVNVTALTELTRLFAGDMQARGYGRILQVSSVGAFQPSPMYAVYSAAKAYVLSASYAMNYELRGSNVSITTVCPGITETEFHQVSGHEKTAFMKMLSMKAPRVASIGLRAMFRRRSMVIPGISNKLNSWLLEGMPRWLSARIVALTMQR